VLSYIQEHIDKTIPLIWTTFFKRERSKGWFQYYPELSSDVLERES